MPRLRWPRFRAIKGGMDKQDILTRLRDNEAALKARGVAHAALFDGPVDVVDREALKPYVAPAATADAIYAF